ncbi:winged helix-turn-helix domain-containing protein [Occallatibacter riparius]|uniref:Winged helix-turn-helix domain-containing protein n=1 Tax=Occallatibacter riparius TaxID=1002689 RepID=A0A9J7BN60_9BACT|nr:winged helix-turn-helix domain-containing protein [Occallatibacter riparius]UWZ82613.1 winged helix-turn-helix domain-containing protein [Occallatibacter riparius]
MSDGSIQRRYRFGTFEADAATGELRRRGIRVRLNAQPFQLLVMLLERPGELVTREEIAGALWPDGTFVDFEHGVNSTMNRIRDALGDSAANPRFVETLARRGYRFIAPVERAEANAADGNGAAEAGPASAAAELEPAPGGILPTPHDLPKASRPLVNALFLLFQLMYLGFYVGALANLAEIQDLLAPLPRAGLVYHLLIVTAAILIPARAFLLCAVLFHAPGFKRRFLRMWIFLLVFDVMWSLAPFLLLHHINFGLALACTALLVYSPFVQRSLVLMGAGGAAPAAES